MTTTAVNDGMAEIVKHNAQQSRLATGPTIRCDGCGAQAYVQVILKDGRELWLCAHEYRVKYALELERVAKTINNYAAALESAK